MFLRRAKIEGFGKLTDKEFLFKPGMNVVFGPNESGKTTLAKFLLYTLTAPNQDALKFKPWNGDKFGGLVETSDGTYTFGEPKDDNISKSVLENVAFLLEDDDIETITLDRNIIESSLKKKSEKTDEGKMLKSAMQNISNLNLKSCIETLSSDLEKIEKEINAIKRENWFEKQTIH